MINPRKIFECNPKNLEYTDDQKSALLLVQAFVHQKKDLFFLLSGNAGTGKTTIAENIARYSNARMLAPTNAAVQRLMEKFDDPVVFQNKGRFSTIHGTLYGAPDPDTGIFLPKEGLVPGCVYIVDECSMIDQDVLNDLISEAKSCKSKLIFLGDDFQLEPVGKDPKIFLWDKSPNPNSKLFNPNWKIKLNEVRRNEGTILEVATHLRNNKGVQILNRDEQDFSLVNIFSHELPIDISHGEDFVVLVSTNKVRMQYNKHIRKAKFEEDSLNPVNNGEKVIAVSNNSFANGETYTIKHPKLLWETDKVVNIASRNDPKFISLTMYLVEHEIEGRVGSFKTLLIPELSLPSLHSYQLMTNYEIAGNTDLTVYKKTIGKRIWNDKVNIATYAYAISVHKSQGNEWNHVYIDADWLSDAWDKARWLYTALTRSKKKVELKISNQFQVVDG